MKKLTYILCFLTLGLTISCSPEENSTDFVNQLQKPSNLSMLFKITQDNSGNVTIRPNGNNVSQYEIDFGDNSPIVLANLGEEITHKYAEGNYQVKLIASNISGETSEISQELTVSFLQPSDLEVIIQPGTNLSVKVRAKANLETFFQIYFGENENEVPTEVIEDEEVTYTYSNPGTYQIKVVALSGGAATLEETFEVNITNLLPAPAPNFPNSNVISLFSNQYNNITVDTWKTEWSQSNFEEVEIAGNHTLKYSNLGFVGIEITNPMIDATQMTHFYLNVFSEDFTEFKIKLVDFGADGAYGGGDDVEHEVTVENVVQGEWNTINIALSEFINLTTRGHIAQIILVGAPSGSTTVYVDNVLFYKEDDMPAGPAPTPSHLQANVISIFSDSYTNVLADTFLTGWSVAQLEQVQINENNVLKYNSLDFVGIETVAQQINVSGMNFLHLDIWTPNATTFKVKLVDFGANGAWSGGDDVEHELSFTDFSQGQWVSLEIPLNNFTGLTTREHIAQIIFSANPTGNATVYIDNIYFHN